MTAAELSKKGGPWLGAVRNFVQRKYKNGERVIWGSADILLPYVTIGDIEEAAAVAVAAYINSQEKK